MRPPPGFNPILRRSLRLSRPPRPSRGRGCYSARRSGWSSPVSFRLSTTSCSNAASGMPWRMPNGLTQASPGPGGPAHPRLADRGPGAEQPGGPAADRCRQARCPAGGAGARRGADAGAAARRCGRAWCRRIPASLVGRSVADATGPGACGGGGGDPGRRAGSRPFPRAGAGSRRYADLVDPARPRRLWRPRRLRRGRRGAVQPRLWSAQPPLRRGLRRRHPAAFLLRPAPRAVGWCGSGDRGSKPQAWLPATSCRGGKAGPSTARTRWARR